MVTDYLRVSEIFYSLQGEGPNLGLPAVFLRLYGCNLKCVWCDSKYAWEGLEVTAMSVSEVQDALHDAWGQQKYNRLLVVTGGEPLLQPQALCDLASRRARVWTVEVETNGTLSPPATLVDLGWWFNVSPKLASAGGRLESRYKPDVLRYFRHIRNARFKFAVATQEDLDELTKIVQVHDIPPERVILMPVGTVIKGLLYHGRWLAAVCKERGWRFSPRLHIELWGNRRGV